MEVPHLHIHIGGVLPGVVVKCSHHRSGSFQEGRMDQLRGTCREGEKVAPEPLHLLSSALKPRGHHPKFPTIPNKWGLPIPALSPDTLAQRWFLTWAGLWAFQLCCGKNVSLSPACLSLFVKDWGWGAGQTGCSPSHEGLSKNITQTFGSVLNRDPEPVSNMLQCAQNLQTEQRPQWKG